MSAVWAALLGAILASVFTTALVALLARIYLKRQISELLESAVAELLPRFRKEVEQGLEDAATEVLPRVRSEVRQGVADGLGDVKEKVLGKTAGSVIDAGLNVLSNISRQKPEE